ncbi:hypothetical protein [Brevundimonas albigilva]|uniref:hypothetical protein n=1 Tax=Brevundimonas albigilva TaxID=1312364 RepID=UPI003221425D
MAGKRFRLGRLLGLILLALIAVPVVGVALFAVVPPTPTILMLQQAAGGAGWTIAGEA